MSNRFHSKYHRHNHHTYGNPSNADAGHDPIASPTSPFLGDFVLAGSLSANAPLSGCAGSFFSNNTALKLTSPQYALWADGKVHITGDLIVDGNATLNLPPPDIDIPEYNFTNGLVEFPSGTISANIDNSTITLNGDGKIQADFSNLIRTLTSSEFSNLIDYQFGNGLASASFSGSGSTQVVRVSSNVDNTSIKINSQGQLSLTKDYQISTSSGLSLDSLTNTLSVSVDNDSIKIDNGKLKSGYAILNSGTGFTKDSNNTLKVVVDDSSIKISPSNQLYSALEFSNGLSKTNNSVSVKYSPRTFTTTNDGFLSAINVLRTDLIETALRPQTVKGHVKLEKQIQVLGGLKFADGSTMTTAVQTKPYVLGLGERGYTGPTSRVYTSDNRVLAWGWNSHISPSDGESIWSPRIIAFKDNYNLNTDATIVKMKYNAYNSCVLFSDGTLWACGWCAGNSLGLKNRLNPTGNYEYIFHQVNIDDFISDFEIAADNNDGTSHLAAISSSGRLYLWGYNRSGALGFNNTSIISSPATPTIVNGKTSEIFFSGVKQVQLSCADGSGKTVVLKDDGSLYSAGINNYGQLGHGITSNQSITFQRCVRFGGSNPPFSSQDTPIAKIANINNFTSLYITLVVTDNGTVYGSGYNLPSNVGSVNSFILLNVLSDIDNIASNGWLTNASYVARTTGGQLYSWGYNGYGQLGTGNLHNVFTPTLISLPGNALADKLIGSTGWSYGGAFGVISTNNRLYTVGFLAVPSSGLAASSVNNSSFKEAPLNNVVDFNIFNINGDARAYIAKDAGNRIFIWGTNAAYYLLGGHNPGSTFTIQEITNYLV